MAQHGKNRLYEDEDTWSVRYPNGTVADDGLFTLRGLSEDEAKTAAKRLRDNGVRVAVVLDRF